MYPIAAVLVTEASRAGSTEDGFAHMSTFGGAELGCVAALKTLEITSRPEIRSMVYYIADLLGGGLRRIQQDHPDWFVGHPPGRPGDGPGVRPPAGRQVRDASALYEHGVWAIFSTLDPQVLQFKPGLLMTPDLCERTAGPGRGGHRRGPPRRGRGHGRGHDRGMAASPMQRADLAEPEPEAGVPRAQAMLQRAQWAAQAFGRYDKRHGGPRSCTPRAAGRAARAREYAEWAVARDRLRCHWSTR